MMGTRTPIKTVMLNTPMSRGELTLPPRARLWYAVHGHRD